MKCAVTHYLRIYIPQTKWRIIISRYSSLKITGFSLAGNVVFVWEWISRRWSYWNCQVFPFHSAVERGREASLPWIKVCYRISEAIHDLSTNFRPDVLDHLMEMKNFSNQFLANALRKFFKEISAPKERDNFLSRILDRFSHKFVQCNPNLSISSGKAIRWSIWRWI